MHDYLNLLIAFLTEWDSACGNSRAQSHSRTDRSHFIKTLISCWVIHSARYTSVDPPIFKCDSSFFSLNISLSEILGQATYRTLWKHSDPFCPTFSCFPFSSLFSLHWLSSTAAQPVSLTFMLAESIQEHLVWHSHLTALGLLDPQCHYLAWHWIHCLPPSHLCSHLDSLSHHSS